MRIFVDTEFNGFKGNLISLGAHADDGSEFYGVLQPPPGDKPLLWVARNVIPVLFAVEPFTRQATFSVDVLARDFRAYVKRLVNTSGQACTVVADWYEDIGHVTNMLVQDHGVQLHPDFIRAFEVIDTGNIDLHPTVRHNALADARALAAYVRQGD